MFLLNVIIVIVYIGWGWYIGFINTITLLTFTPQILELCIACPLICEDD